MKRFTPLSFFPGELLIVGLHAAVEHPTTEKALKGGQ
jgi:hypothetical protein